MRHKHHTGYLTGSRAARVLNVTRQAVSSALYRGAMVATGGPGNWRIPLEEVVRYAIRTSDEPLDSLVEGIQDELRVDWLWAAKAVLGTLGLQSVIDKIDPESGARDEGAGSSEEPPI